MAVTKKEIQIHVGELRTKLLDAEDLTEGTIAHIIYLIGQIDQAIVTGKEANR